MARLIDAMDRAAERLRSEPGWRELTAEEFARAQRGLDEALERYRIEWTAVRAFSEKVERDQAGGLA